METNTTEEKGIKSAPRTTAWPYSTLHVAKEVRKKVLQELSKINKKDFGKRVRASDYIALAISRITPEDHKMLQEASMSGEDRIKRQHKEYIAKYGLITWGDYLWKRTNGEISAPSNSIAPKNAGESSN